MTLPWASVIERSAELPFDFVVGRDAGLGEEAAEGEAGGLLLTRRADVSDSGLGFDLVFSLH